MTIKIQPRIQVFDIETVDSIDTIKAPEAVPCMTFFDVATNVYHVFCFGFKSHETAQVQLRLQQYWTANVIPKLLKYNFSNPFLVFHSHDTEKQMLGDLLSFINNNRPDVISPWNRTFDMPYIVQRMKNLNLPYSALSEVQKVYFNSKDETITIGGIAEVDLMEHYAYSLPQKARSKSLDFSANKEFGIGKMPRTSIKEMLKKDRVGLLAYNVVDTQLSYALINECKLFNNMQTIEQISNAGLDNQSPLRIIDSFIMTSLRDRKIAVPTNIHRKREEKKEGGAYVHEATIGKHNNVIVLDFKSYYTSVMMDGNVCASTKITSEEIRQHIQSPCTDTELQEYIYKNYIHCPNGAIFRKDKRGIVPEILVAVREERNRHKRLMKEALDEQTRNVEDRLQSGFKRIGNESYGQFKNPHFRLMDKDIAEAITSVCKALTIRVIDILEKINIQDLINKFKHEIREIEFNQLIPKLNILLKIIYGDTDSLMIKLPDVLSGSEMKIVGKIIEKYVNSLLPSLTKSMFNIDREFIEIEFDTKKVMQSFIQMPKKDSDTGAKKRYIYIAYKDDNTLDTDPHFVGVDVMRSDTNPLMVDVQTRLAKLILNDAPYKDIRLYLLNIYNNFNKQPPESLLIKETLHKFGTDSTSPQVIGAIYANTYLQKSFRSGSTVYYLYLKSTPNGYPRMTTTGLKALCLDYNEPVPKAFLEHIDWDKMRDTSLIQPTDTILEAVGYKWSEIITGTKEVKAAERKIMVAGGFD